MNIKNMLTITLSLFSLPMLSVVEIIPNKKKQIQKGSEKLYDFVQDSALNNPCKLLMTQEKLTSDLPFIDCLGECTAGSCGLDRSSHPWVRKAYESEIVDAIVEKSVTKKGPVNYVNFAAGGSLQDLIVGTQVIQRGVSALNIHIIDEQNRGYSACIKRDEAATTLIPTIEAFSPVLHPKKQIERKINAQEKTTQETFADNDISSEIIDRVHKKYSQLTQWFNNKYPHVTIRIFIYADIQEYKEFCKKNKNFVADVVTGMDFGIEFEINEGYRDMYELLEFVAIHNPRFVGIHALKDLEIWTLKDQAVPQQGFYLIKFHTKQYQADTSYSLLVNTVKNEKELIKKIAIQQKVQWGRTDEMEEAELVTIKNTFKIRDLLCNNSFFIGSAKQLPNPLFKNLEKGLISTIGMAITGLALFKAFSLFHK